MEPAGTGRISNGAWPWRCERAGLRSRMIGTFYALRHSYISRAIEGEVPLNIVPSDCGTSVRIIETTYAKVLAEQAPGTSLNVALQVLDGAEGPQLVLNSITHHDPARDSQARFASAAP